MSDLEAVEMFKKNNKPKFIDAFGVNSKSVLAQWEINGIAFYEVGLKTNSICGWKYESN